VSRSARWLLGLAVLGALLALRHDVPARPHPRRLRTASQVAGAGLAVAVAHAGWLAAVTADSPVTSVRVALAPFGTGLVAAGAAIVALAVALAPAPPPPPASAAERAWVAALVAHPDADSLAPFATRTDRTYAVSPDGRAAIGYRVLGGTALAGGDPVGDRTAAAAAIAAFLDTCARNGWRPAVLGASDAARERWHAHGMRRGVVIGDEAILDVASFTA